MSTKKSKGKNTDTPTDVEVQPTLPGMELPEHYGRAPVTQTTKFSGAGSRFLGQHEAGTRAVFVVEAVCRKAGPFSVDADGALDYAETFALVDVFEISGAAGPRSVSALRQAYRVGEDGIEGRQKVEGVEGRTDGSGVVMSSAEVAELRGDPLTVAFDPRMKPVVILYADGARELWPEQFEPNAPQPLAGDHYGTEAGETTYVERVIDAVTGETVDEWTTKQEKARLKALEEKLEAEESED